MTVQHDQYFSYSEKPNRSRACIMCGNPTTDWLAYDPPGLPATLERPCCRSCINSAYNTIREIADGFSAGARALSRLRELFGGGK